MRYVGFLCCLLALAGVAVAGEPVVTATASGEIATIVPGTRVTPEYPPAALEARFGGSVVLAVAIDELGDVGKVEVLDSTHPNLGFEDAAIVAIKKWRFEPALRDGEPIASVAGYSLHFEVPPRGMTGGLVSGYHLASAMATASASLATPGATLLGVGDDDDKRMRPDRGQLARLVDVSLRKRSVFDAGPGDRSVPRKSPIQPNLPMK